MMKITEKNTLFKDCLLVLFPLFSVLCIPRILAFLHTEYVTVQYNGGAYILAESVIVLLFAIVLAYLSMYFYESQKRRADTCFIGAYLFCIFYTICFFAVRFCGLFTEMDWVNVIFKMNNAYYYLLPLFLIGFYAVLLLLKKRRQGDTAAK